MASSTNSSLHATKEWRFSQCFGETAAQAEQSEADILSAVEFDQTGRFLATGDRGGRIVVFETEKTAPGSSASTTAAAAAAAAITSSDDAKKDGKKRKSNTEYRFHCEFQSHEPEFDYLKSLEIEEKINQIKWCPPCGGSLFLLSTNGELIIDLQRNFHLFETKPPPTNKSQQLTRYESRLSPPSAPLLHRQDNKTMEDIRQTNQIRHGNERKTRSLPSGGIRGTVHECIGGIE